MDYFFVEMAAMTMTSQQIGNKMLTNNYQIIDAQNYENQRVLLQTPSPQMLSPVEYQQQLPTKRPLAPAPERQTVLMSQQPPAKRKAYQNQNYGIQPASVARRNARERNRVKQVNNGFATLRQHIPSSVATALSAGRGASKKLSKVDTLRMAVEYIRGLQQLLDEVDGNNRDVDREVARESSMMVQTPPCSESSASPTPSFASDGSLGGQAYPAVSTDLQFRDSYDAYEPMSPEDEELLDVISWWQQQ